MAGPFPFDFSNRPWNKTRHETSCVSMQLLWRPFVLSPFSCLIKGSMQLLWRPFVLSAFSCLIRAACSCYGDHIVLSPFSCLIRAACSCYGYHIVLSPFSCLIRAACSSCFLVWATGLPAACNQVLTEDLLIPTVVCQVMHPANSAY